MADRKQLECRVIITHEPLQMFALGMYDPVRGRYQPLGKHPTRDIERIVKDLVASMERVGHKVTFSEVTGPR
jgi:hypothetical protein